MEGNYCYQYPHPAITADCLVFASSSSADMSLARGGGLSPAVL